MPSKHPHARQSAGFSLSEALVALAIAATLAAATTRFVASTRFNASKIRQEVAIDLVSETLMERFAPGHWKAGQWNGRSAALGWRMNVEPMSFDARVLSMKTKWGDKATDPNGGTALGLSAMEGDNDQKSGSAAKPESENLTPWILYRVDTVVSAPLGLGRAVDTIRIGPPAAEKGPSDASSR